ncbi:hypothetical protein D3C81_1381610 [compost metagenome]
MEQGCLAATAGDAVALRGVLTVLDDIQIEGAHLNRTELHQTLYHFMEIVIGVSLFDILLRRQCTTHRPAIQDYHIFRCHAVGARLKPVQVGQQEARGVTDAAVRIGGAFQDLVRHGNFTGVVGRSDPQAQDVATQLVHHVLWTDGIADRLGHLAALTVHGEAVGQNFFIRCLAFHRSGDHQR